MKDFVFHNPTKIVFGKNSMDKIRENVDLYGKKVMVTYGGGSIKSNGIYDKVMEQLNGLEVMEFGGIEPNPRVETIRKAVELARKFEPDIILAVGGGSTIDGSKLLASAIYYEGDAWDIVKKQIKPNRFVPLAVVLTLNATGSEMNHGAVITNWTTNEKLFFGHDELYPKFSVLDPQNTFSLPKEQIAYGVVDTFSHVLEQYINTILDANLQDRFAEGILATLIENAPKAIEKPTDYSVRANLMWASTLALNTLIASGVNEDWATHMIEHEISAFYDITHAAGLAIITPRWMDVVAKVQKKDKMVQNEYGDWMVLTKR